MAFTDLKKDELVEAARYYKVPIEHDYTKAQISVALLDAGKTPEQWDEDREAYLNGQSGVKPEPTAITTDDLKGGEADEEAGDDTEEEPVEEEPVKEQKSDDRVLIRFTGRQRSYQVAGLKFDQRKPFALVSREKANQLDPRIFREATKAEAAEFYGK